MNDTADYYPMPAFTRLVVTDLAASARWYEEVLGFQSVFSIPGPDSAPLLVHLRWIKYADLLLAAENPRIKPSGQRGEGVTLYFQAVTRRVDEIAETAKSKGADIANGPVDTPWNTHEVLIRDPDGYLLAFTEGPVDAGAGIDRVVARLRNKE